MESFKYNYVDSKDIDASLDLAILNVFGPVELWHNQNYNKDQYFDDRKISEVSITIVYQILEKTKLYKKNDVYKEFKQRIFYKFEKYGCKDYELKSFFERLWLCKFSKLKKEESLWLHYRPIFKYALSNQPNVYWIFNSRFFIFIFAIVFLFIEYFIASSSVGGHFFREIDWRLFALKMVLLFAGFRVFLSTEVYKFACFVPLVLVFLYNNFDIYVEIPRALWRFDVCMEKLHLYRLNITLAFIFLIWYPIVNINIERWRTYVDLKYFERKGYPRIRRY